MNIRSQVKIARAMADADNLDWFEISEQARDSYLDAAEKTMREHAAAMATQTGSADGSAK